MMEWQVQVVVWIILTCQIPLLLQFATEVLILVHKVGGESEKPQQRMGQ